MFCTGDEALLWKVSNMAGKDGMDTSNSPIRTDHLDTISACFDKRLQDDSHGLVEESLNEGAMLLVGHLGTIHLLN